MLSRTSEYAIRAALWLAGRPRQVVSVREIARETGVPPGYLAKILQSMGRTGIVRAQPGPGGGFSLARPPDEVHVVEVLDAIRPLRMIERCPLGRAEHVDQLCPFHARLNQAIEAVQAVFSGCTLHQLLEESGGRAVCPAGFDDSNTSSKAAAEAARSTDTCPGGSGAGPATARTKGTDP